jgi:hypothetical protein
MKISVHCALCRKRHELSTRFAGRQVICRGCGVPLDVPPLEVGDELQFAPDDMPKRRDPTEGRQHHDDPPHSRVDLGAGDVIPLASPDQPVSKEPPSPFPPRP